MLLIARIFQSRRSNLTVRAFANARCVWQDILKTHSVDDIVNCSPSVMRKARAAHHDLTHVPPGTNLLKDSMWAGETKAAAAWDEKAGLTHISTMANKPRWQRYLETGHELLHACQWQHPRLRILRSTDDGMSVFNASHTLMAWWGNLPKAYMARHSVDTPEAYQAMLSHSLAEISGTAANYIKDLPDKALRLLKTLYCCEVQTYTAERRGVISLLRRVNPEATETVQGLQLYYMDVQAQRKYYKQMLSVIRQEQAFRRVKKT